MEKHIIIKPCPVCGAFPRLKKRRLGRLCAQDYTGHSDYQFRCECCRLLRGGAYPDIYITPEEAVTLVKSSWNDEVTRIEKLMQQRNCE